jgi:hypothetical protein
MNGAMAPFRTQMQQEKQKYRNAANKVGACPVFRKLLKPDKVMVLRKSKRC